MTHHRRGLRRLLEDDELLARIEADPLGAGLDERRAAMLAYVVQLTRAHHPTAPGERRQDVTVLDVFENAASVKVVAAGWIDYLHLARCNGRWLIVNVLWELEPGRPFTPWW